jgi:hypothetical protein
VSIFFLRSPVKFPVLYYLFALLDVGTAQSAIDARLDVVEGKCYITLLENKILIGGIELVQTEERFTDIRDALKALNKMDFDKLIASVSGVHLLAIIVHVDRIWLPQVGGKRGARF